MEDHASDAVTSSTAFKRGWKDGYAEGFGKASVGALWGDKHVPIEWVMLRAAYRELLDRQGPDAPERDFFEKALAAVEPAKAAPAISHPDQERA